MERHIHKETIIDTNQHIYAIDIDGVLADFGLEFTLFANKKFKTPVIGDHSRKEWNFSSIGLDADQIAQVWHEINESPNFWVRMKTLCTPEELSAIDSLAHDDLVYFITSRCGVSAKGQTLDWLQERGVCNHGVYVVDRPSDKAELAKSLGVITAIDDKPETCVEYANIGIPDVYLMRRQYNQPFEHPGVKVVGSILEFFYDNGISRGWKPTEEAA